MRIDDIIEKCDEAEAIVIEMIQSIAAADKDRSFNSDFRFMSDKLSQISSLTDDLRRHRAKKSVTIDPDMDALFQ
jgi:hypothetical protein